MASPRFSTVDGSQFEVALLFGLVLLLTTSR
ncbi:hypothetical protein AH2_00036 [Burkholderia phage vB_BceS_AH2]|uniref:Uncharacterized protein n=1 Tax=Burkholderia phage vB_BceS_AH2 TaxID=1133022 RepID=I6NSR9_9CAUD|nr:hypothetical protein B613_gp36 [Burkholderia phage vB_BceS_AH2]AEY69546.1 hypothetical protein AH2_00036 [Burkholderia phage vB_BceS_AH2]